MSSHSSSRKEISECQSCRLSVRSHTASELYWVEHAASRIQTEPTSDAHMCSEWLCVSWRLWRCSVQYNSAVLWFVVFLLKQQFHTVSRWMHAVPGTILLHSLLPIYHMYYYTYIAVCIAAHSTTCMVTEVLYPAYNTAETEVIDKITEILTQRLPTR